MIDWRYDDGGAASEAAPSPRRMRVAVIGAGISGNVCAWLLHPHHDVHLFESQPRPGGHTHTVDVEVEGRDYAVDTGFMVFNHRTYPNFVRILQRLRVSSQPSDMSFSVTCDRTGWQYQGSSLNGLFAQRGNLLRPRFYRMLADILRFNRLATHLRNDLDDQLTVRQFLQSAKLGNDFVDRYLVPMTAAIWSSPAGETLEMPARFLFEFCHNHGLLQIRQRPRWRTIPGGARSYVRAMLKPLGPRVALGTAVSRVDRSERGVTLRFERGEPRRFDRVIFACHADDALRLLAHPSRLESDVLARFRYQDNLAILHTDRHCLPPCRRAWASWNYRVKRDPSQPVSVTYDLNRLQRLGAPQPICVTLNDADLLNSAKVLAEIRYRHPVFGPHTLSAQRRHDQLNGRRNSYFCGAYWGYGFHEDGVRSALTVCRHFGCTLDESPRRTQPALIES